MRGGVEAKGIPAYPRFVGLLFGFPTLMPTARPANNMFASGLMKCYRSTFWVHKIFKRHRAVASNESVYSKHTLHHLAQTKDFRTFLKTVHCELHFRHQS